MSVTSTQLTPLNITQAECKISKLTYSIMTCIRSDGCSNPSAGCFLHSSIHHLVQIMSEIVNDACFVQQSEAKDSLFTATRDKEKQQILTNVAQTEKYEALSLWKNYRNNSLMIRTAASYFSAQNE